MAYCDRCGAYIPDGWTVCPACGFDKAQEEKQNQQAAAAQAHQQEQEKFAREEAEKRRAQRQAYDKAWAENEQRRRREEEELRKKQQEQEERRRQEQEKYRQEQNNSGVHIYVDAEGNKNVHVGDRVHVVVNPNGTKTVQVGDAWNSYTKAESAPKAEQTVNQAAGRVLPILSYLGPLCFLSLILGNDSFTRFHAKQGLRLFIWSAILEVVGGIFSIGWAVAVFQVIMAVIGIRNAANGEEKKLPYIGG